MMHTENITPAAGAPAAKAKQGKRCYKCNDTGKRYRKSRGTFTLCNCGMAGKLMNAQILIGRMSEADQAALIKAARSPQKIKCLSPMPLAYSPA